MFLFLTFSSSHLSFCPKEGHFCPMEDSNIYVKRWAIDWEEKIAKELICSQILKCIGVCGMYKEYLFINFTLGSICWILSNKHIYWEKMRMWVLFSSADYMATQLYMLRNWRNLLCSNTFTIYVHEDVMRLHSVLIEWGDDIHMQ